MVKFAYLQEDKIVLIVEVESVDELLPLDKKYQNLVELTGFDPEPKIGWYFENNKFRDNTSASNVSGPVKQTKITRLAFINRFTLQESVAYEMALTSSPVLRALDKKLSASTYVDLSRPDTIAGIQALASVGILTPSRASEILNTEPTAIELYKG